MRESRRGYAKPILAGAALAATATLAGLAAGSSALAAPTEAAVRGAGGASAIRDSYIVVLKDGGAAEDKVSASAHDLSRRYGGSLRNSFSSTVRGFSARMTEKQARKLAANPDVDYVEQDHAVSVTGSQANPASWGLDRIDQQALPLSGSYAYPSTASTVHAYIIDTGIRTSHTDFGGRATSGYDFIDNDTNADDCAGHGTHVAGTVGGGAYGVAKGVSLVGVRVLGCDGLGSYSQIIAGVDWVTKNAVKPAVANMSLGGSAGSTLDDAVRKSIASGVTYAVAGGNDSADACSKSPARLAEAITVGAIDKTDTRGDFSNYGSCLDIFAPGVNILSASKASDTGTAWMTGTSMATPHVAGAAALVLAANPTYTPQQVRDYLVGASSTGSVKNPGSGSPNRILYTGGIAAAPVTVPVPVPTTTTPPVCTPVANASNLTVPDLRTVSSQLTIAGCTGKASVRSTVRVRVVHPHRGDISLDLLAPDGSVYKLKSANTSDGAANISTTYTVDLSSENRNGNWRLRVHDNFSNYTGYIDSWTLSL
jgi:subtilisin family serine protease